MIGPGVIGAIIAARLFDGHSFRSDQAVLVRDRLVLDVVSPGGLPEGATVEAVRDGLTLCPG